MPIDQRTQELAKLAVNYSIMVKSGEKIISYLCIAKDKKIISYSDLTSSLEKGKKLGLPIFFLSTGEPNKKAKEWIDYLKELVIFKKLE